MESNLISRAQTGNAAAIGTIYEMHQDVIFRFLCYQTGDKHIAEDLTADVFLRMITAIPRYQQRNIPLKSWLLQISRNLVIDHFRRSKLRVNLELKENLISDSLRPESHTEQSLLHDDLYKALGKLTTDQRDVIILRFITEMPIREVSQLLGKNESAIKALQRRGLRALNKTLTDWRKPND